MTDPRLDDLVRLLDDPAGPSPEAASAAIDAFLHDVLDTGAGALAGSVHIHCTDTAGEWTIRQGDDGLVVSREHAKGDCAIRGAAVDILRALLRRGSLDACDVVGDAGAAAAFVAASAF